MRADTSLQALWEDRQHIQQDRGELQIKYFLGAVSERCTDMARSQKSRTWRHEIADSRGEDMEYKTGERSQVCEMTNTGHCPSDEQSATVPGRLDNSRLRLQQGKEGLQEEAL